jgi:hypothetical protein
MIHWTTRPSLRVASWRRTGLLLAVAWIVTLAGCTTIPVQEMSDARQAIEAAAQAGGDQKAAALMREARTALASAEYALKDVQYRSARQLAQQARAKAIEAQRASE